jgi:fused signal recognition particle receptor
MAIGFFKSLIERFSGKEIDWEELEETLIRSDLGVQMALQIIKELQERNDKITAADVVEVARSHIEQILPITNPKLRPLPNRPKVILMVGVNGTGKTTSTAKLANLLKQDRHSVMFAADHTIRGEAVGDGYSLRREHVYGDQQPAGNEGEAREQQRYVHLEVCLRCGSGMRPRRRMSR